MGMENADKINEEFEKLNETQQLEYFSRYYGEMLGDRWKDYEDEQVEEEIKEIRKLKKETDDRVILNTEHFAVEVKRSNDDLGIIIDVFHRHGDLIDTFTFWNEDVKWN